MDSAKNLQTKEGRIAAIETIEKSLLKSLRINLVEISDDAVCSIDRGKATIGIKPVGEYKKKGFKMAFASEIDIFAINDKYCFGKSANEINFGSSGSFSPEIRECYWRTIHAASFLKNWKVVCDIVNEHCKMYSDLEEEIIKVNNISV